VSPNCEERIKKSTSRNIRFIQYAPDSCKPNGNFIRFLQIFKEDVLTASTNSSLILFKDYRNQHYREFGEDIGDVEQIGRYLKPLTDHPFHNASEIPITDKNP
jgi:hypothetical protein